MPADLPYHFVVRLQTGRWAVVHRVPRVGVDHIDADCPTLRTAQETAASLNQQRECGWQIANTFMEPACHTTDA